MLKLLQDRRNVSVREAEKNGIRNPRQQVAFLREAGWRIINVDKRLYALQK